MIINNTTKLGTLFNKSRLHNILEGKVILNKLTPIKFLKPKINFYTTKKKFLTKWYWESVIETINFKKYSFFAEKSYTLQTNYLYFCEQKKKKKTITFVDLKFYNVKATVRQLVFHRKSLTIERFARIVRIKKKKLFTLNVLKYKFNFFFINLRHTIKIFRLNIVEKHKIGIICSNMYIERMVGRFIRSTRIFKIKSKAFWVIARALLSNIRLLNLILKQIFTKSLLKKFYSKLQDKYLLIYRYISILIKLTVKVFKRIPKRATGLMLHILTFFYFWYFNSVLEHKKNKLGILFFKNYKKLPLMPTNIFYTKMYKNICYRETLAHVKKGLLITFYNFLSYIFNIANIKEKYIFIIKKTLIGFNSTKKTKRQPPVWFLKFFEHVQYYNRLKAYLRVRLKGKKKLHLKTKKLNKFKIAVLKKKKKTTIFLY